MGWIKDRIDAEYRKHHKSLEWSLMAEKKIKSQLKEVIKDWWMRHPRSIPEDALDDINRRLEDYTFQDKKVKGCGKRYISEGALKLERTCGSNQGRSLCDECREPDKSECTCEKDWVKETGSGKCRHCIKKEKELSVEEQSRIELHKDYEDVK